MIFEMGAKLEGDNFDTSRNHKKNRKIDSKIKDKSQHQLVFTFEKRKGKLVTLVGRFNLDEKEKKELLKLLKKKLACGGSLKDDWIELQGEVKQKVIDTLCKEGWKFK